MKVNVPEGQRGAWRVERFEISESDSAMSMFSYKHRAPEPGTYTRLMRGGQLVMSDTPAEQRDHQAPAYQAKLRGGRVLIHGLGLGMVLGAILKHRTVTAVDVVELSPEVIELVWPTYADDPRVTIHQGDALTYKFKPGQYWSVAWHDIWTDVSEDDLPSMHKLTRRYAGRVSWQRCWGKALIERYR